MSSNVFSPTTAAPPGSASSPAAPSSAAPSGLHLAYLDGIRGLAAFYVMLHHLWKIWYGPYTQDSTFGFFTNWLLQGGRLAVSVFIVLSGFCLMLPVVRANGQLRGGVLAFYKRRARRILPPFYAALLVSLVLTAIDALCFDSARRDAFSRQNLLGNVLLLQDVLPRVNAFNLPFWTVAVEWKIYFLFPLYVAACRKGVWAGAAFAAVLGFAVTVVCHLARPSATLFQSCPWYLFSFGMGVCAAWLAVRHGGEALQSGTLRKGAWAVFGILAGGIWLTINRVPLGVAGGEFYIRFAPLIDCVTALAAASGLLALYLQSSARKANAKPPVVLRLLEWKPLVFVGMWAYSLYLLHYPILDLWRVACLRFFGSFSPSAQVMVYSFVGVLLCLGAAYGFFLLVEKPFLRKSAGAAVPVPAVL